MSRVGFWFLIFRLEREEAASKGESRIMAERTESSTVDSSEVSSGVAKSCGSTSILLFQLPMARGPPFGLPWL